MAMISHRRRGIGFGSLKAKTPIPALYSGFDGMVWSFLVPRILAASPPRDDFMLTPVHGREDPSEFGRLLPLLLHQSLDHKLCLLLRLKYTVCRARLEFLYEAAVAHCLVSSLHINSTATHSEDST